MILGWPRAFAGDSTYGRATLDDLFRRAALRDVDAVALNDPPHRETFMDGAPRRLTWAQADRAISAVATKLRQLGLPTDAVVAVQLPNTIESIVALLGVIRAGLIAAPLPLLWRKHDIVKALKSLGVRAIVTASRLGSTAHAELAMEAAAELFPVRHVCAFGGNLPDGIVPLDGVFAAGASFGPSPPRAEQPAAHIAVITFDQTADGIRVSARNHHQLIAGGLTSYAEAGAPRDRPWLSALPASSFAGLSLTLVPWLLGGGTLNLHHAFDADAFAAQASVQTGGTVIVPAPVLHLLNGAGCTGSAATILALWRTPERLASAPDWNGDAALIDVAAFGELGLTAGRRGSDGLPSPIPLGPVQVPGHSGSGMVVLETGRSTSGTLTLGGAMVPAQVSPAGTAPPRELKTAVADSGMPCRAEADGRTVIITGPVPGTTAIGGYRFMQTEIDRVISEIDPGATLVALPDALLGERLAGTAADAEEIIAKIESRGLNPLMATAFRPRQPAAA